MRKTYLVGFAIVAIILIAFLLSRDSDEERILNALEELRVLVEISKPEGSIGQLARSQQISEFFTDETEFDLANLGYKIYTIENREELAKITFKARKGLSSLELSLRDAHVSIKGEHANVKVEISVLGHGMNKDNLFLEVHSIRIELVRVDDEWLISGGQHLRDERNQNNS